MKLLLNHSQTSVNEVDIKSQTALSVAASKGYLRMVKLMLRCPKTHHQMEVDEIDSKYKYDISPNLSNALH